VVAVGRAVRALQVAYEHRPRARRPRRRRLGAGL